ncbi:MAG: hypothetical protein A3G09_01210 [Candidatus Moranbacteria bacterium RIFCSPLOWO2_12_FULL_48_12]|nr:MAG: hypothetical protein A3G09_01210 [Candidatus Moranbacteria bacterium RIFCSPLOWO2_12_FULL_48_12]
MRKTDKKPLRQLADWGFLFFELKEPKKAKLLSFLTTFLLLCSLLSLGCFFLSHNTHLLLHLLLIFMLHKFMGRKRKRIIFFVSHNKCLFSLCVIQKNFPVHFYYTLFYAKYNKKIISVNPVRSLAG